VTLEDLVRLVQRRQRDHNLGILALGGLPGRFQSFADEAEGAMRLAQQFQGQLNALFAAREHGQDRNGRFAARAYQ